MKVNDIRAKDATELPSYETKLIKSNKVTMFHDGECPLCKHEVKMMQKLDTRKSVEWVDISKNKQALETAGISYEDAMARIHVQDENQQLQTGVKGFLLVWKQLPYYKRLAFIVERVPFLLPIMEFCYSIFAKYRLSLTGKKL